MDQKTLKPMPIPNWSPKTPEWSTKCLRLLLSFKAEKPKKLTMKQLTEKSDAFPIKFPIDTGRCKTLKRYVAVDVLERNINSVYPIMHENILELCAKFIWFKRTEGSDVEKSFYKDMNLEDFIDRLLRKRAVMFMGKNDKYLLIDGSKGSKNWETIGTKKEKPPLVLRNCLSYDEIKLSVFLSASSYTYFVNVGDRKNKAVYCEDRSGIEKEGIIVGMIGPRMKKANVMEFQEIVTSKTQNKTSNGYGESASSIHSLFSSFYEEPCMDLEELLKFRKSLPANQNRYVDLKNKNIFDNHLYYKRLTISIDTLLMEANFRAETAGKTAYVHVVGLGLGVWKIAPHQEAVYMDSFYKRIVHLGKNLSCISDVCFSYINEPSCGGYPNGKSIPIEGHPLGGIKVHIFKRNPHAKLSGENAGKLSVVSYAWDGNALPGNEYWSGKLGSSGDSAAASSTQIAEIHNPHINSVLCADNLRVVTSEGVVDIEKYQEMVRCRKNKRRASDSE